ncbi:class I SAM-dependent methyltransferase [Pontibacillus yanchengensis]|uniref:SAM-dependent methyltransferase n=1 Tax=Pontibacillus yanchengensis Y32 TaxID=1385514 RepID=A0A0A2T5K9_9BACI|nr:methyltransferase domain-containing protein [Pontibacillus yanchengensis]KGP71087.1 SAM-dependent methyltransferase [Pontibacillus yanchengensis Y32]
MEDTGERVIPEYMKSSNKLLLEHMARYQFALPYVQGRVLDLSCGAGYGTHMMAKERKHETEEVIGIDIDEEIIHYAKGAYHHPKSSFKVMNAVDPDLPEKLGTFDTIISYETYEHIKEEELLLQNYYRLLKPGGTLLVSTPFGKGRGKECGSPFHVHQLTPEEFQELFTDYRSTEFFYQKGVLIEPPREDVHYPLGIAVCTK